MSSIISVSDDPQNTTLRQLYERRLDELVESVKSAALNTSTIKDRIVSSSLVRLQKVVNSRDDGQDVYDLQDIQLIYDQSLTEQLAAVFRQCLHSEQETAIRRSLETESNLLRKNATLAGELTALKAQLSSTATSLKEAELKLKNYDELEKYAQFLRKESKDLKQRIFLLEKNSRELAEENKKYVSIIQGTRKECDNLSDVTKELLATRTSHEKLGIECADLKERNKALDTELRMARQIIDNAKVNYKRELQAALTNETQRIRNECEASKTRYELAYKQKIIDTQSSFTLNKETFARELRVQFEKDRDENYIKKSIYSNDMRAYEAENKSLDALLKEKSQQIAALRLQLQTTEEKQQSLAVADYVATIPAIRAEEERKLREEQKKTERVLEDQVKLQAYINEAEVRYKNLESNLVDSQRLCKQLAQHRDVLLSTLREKVLPELATIKHKNAVLRSLLERFFGRDMINNFDLTENGLTNPNFKKFNGDSEMGSLLVQKLSLARKALSKLYSQIIVNNERVKLRTDELMAEFAAEKQKIIESSKIQVETVRLDLELELEKKKSEAKEQLRNERKIALDNFNRVKGLLEDIKSAAKIEF